jgi:fatty acid desaturase
MDNPPTFNTTRSLLDIERKTLERLSQPAPLRLMLQVLIEWTWIIGTVMFALNMASIWISVIAIIFVGTRQHALLALMHDFSHRQFSRTRVVLNDTLGDVFTALPFLITVHGFRRDHLQHHHYTSTEQDPNWVSSMKQARYKFPQSRFSVLYLLALHCLGFYALKDIKGYLFDSKMTVNMPRATQLRQLFFALFVIGIAFAFNLWIVIALYWFLPMFTILLALLYLRDVAEHCAMPSDGLCVTRTVLTRKLEGFLISPNAVNLHAEHHLYPSVPFCRLYELHHLIKQKSVYRTHAVITQGYFSGLLSEMSQTRWLSHKI